MSLKEKSIGEYKESTKSNNSITSTGTTTKNVEKFIENSINFFFFFFFRF